MKGWHFLKEDRRLQFGDSQVVKPGDVSRVDGELRMCEWGLHASKRAIDALKYAPGPIVCRVELRCDLQHDADKSVGREREVIWMADATDTLRRFARRCALDVIDLWDAPDVVVRYLKTGDESLRAAAWDAAYAAARAAAWAAARGAARAKQNRRLTAMLSRLKP